LESDIVVKSCPKGNTVEIDISHSHPLRYGLLFCER
jgi:hypothetical protein